MKWSSLLAILLVALITSEIVFIAKGWLTIPWAILLNTTTAIIIAIIAVVVEKIRGK